MYKHEINIDELYSIKVNQIKKAWDDTAHLPRQGTRKWLECKKGTISGTSLKYVIGGSVGNTDLMYKMMGHSRDFIQTNAPRWGSVSEIMTEYMMNVLFETKIVDFPSITSCIYRRKTYSPDGLSVVMVGGYPVMVLWEFKSPYSRKLKPNDKYKVYSDYIPQVMGGMCDIPCVDMAIFVEMKFKICSFANFNLSKYDHSSGQTDGKVTRGTAGYCYDYPNNDKTLKNFDILGAGLVGYHIVEHYDEKECEYEGITELLQFLMDEYWFDKDIGANSMLGKDINIMDDVMSRAEERASKELIEFIRRTHVNKKCNIPNCIIDYFFIYVSLYNNNFATTQLDVLFSDDIYDHTDLIDIKTENRNFQKVRTSKLSDLMDKYDFFVCWKLYEINIASAEKDPSYVTKMVKKMDKLLGVFDKFKHIKCEDEDDFESLTVEIEYELTK